MKIITLLITLIGTSAFAQTEAFSLPENATPITTAAYTPLSPCTMSETDDTVDTGFGHTDTYEVADNFVVADGESFSVEKITVRILVNAITSIPDVTVRFYEMADPDFPSQTILSEQVVTPSSQNVLGTASGLNILELELDITPTTLDGVNGSETTYWVSIYTPNSSSNVNYIETILDGETSDTTLAKFRNGNDQNDDWESSYLVTDIMYNMDPALRIIIEGECTALSIEDRTLQYFSIYPNPIDAFFTLNPKQGVTIKDVVLYDMHGKATKVSSVDNKTFDVSFLSSGIYLLSVTTDHNTTVTKKIVKH
ncbi:MAG: T9SS type A sorting domain-containing protein [Flavobacteriaceae bacterium]|nr:T9SS type A sorting domain-containing protein [Flavobacteriaceae bacterium]